MMYEKNLRQDNWEIDHDLLIDESALDVECIEQSHLALKYIRIAIQARKKAKLAEERVKTVRSELIAQANKTPVECTGKVKPNAQDIQAYYRMQEVYKKAKTDMIDAQLTASLVEQGKDLFVYQRKASLENLITLHGQQYFAGPKTPRNLPYEIKQRSQERRQRKVDNNVRVAMRKKD